MRHWWVAGTFFCCYVATESGVITDAAPILAKFIGQPMINLERWAHYERREEIWMT